MRKRSIIALIVVAMVVLACGVLLAEENNAKAAAATPPAQAAAPAVTATPAVPGAVPASPMGFGPATGKPAFSIIFGTIENVDNSDPAKPKITVKSEIDGSLKTISVSPWTNITKITDFSEIKVGESARVMSRVVNDEETAMTVVFGKIKNVYRPMVPPQAAQTGAPQAPQTGAREQQGKTPPQQ